MIAVGITVLFDMDGVLVDSEPVINKAAILGLAEYGVKAVPKLNKKHLILSARIALRC